MLESIDSNTGERYLARRMGYGSVSLDTTKSTAIMSVVIHQGGLGTGVLNFDCNVRHERVVPWPYQFDGYLCTWTLEC